MQIHIEALIFDAIIGLLDSERERPQRVVVDLAADYTYNQKDFVDYADIVSLIKETIQTRRYKLLEEALLELKELLHHAFPQIYSLTLKISKPDILPECTVAISSRWDF